MPVISGAVRGSDSLDAEAETPLQPAFSLPASPRGQALLGVQTLVLVVMAVSVVSRLWQDYLWFGPVLLGISVIVWTPEFVRRRDRLAWFFYVAGVFAYTLLRALADETPIPVRTDYVIEFDAALPGPSLVQQLQEWRDGWGWRRGVDYAAIGTHWSYFIAPHALAVWIFLRRRTQFPLYAGLTVLTVWFGLALFFLLPTVPPWLAGEQGDLPGVTRVMDDTVRDAIGSDEAGAAYDDLYAALGEPNSVAAMPSIHMGITFSMFLWASRFAKRWAPWLLAYTVVMGLALAYLGEHYIADQLAGVGIAAVAWWILLRAPALRPGVVARAKT